MRTTITAVIISQIFVVNAMSTSVVPIKPNDPNAPQIQNVTCPALTVDMVSSFHGTSVQKLINGMFWRFQDSSMLNGRFERLRDSHILTITRDTPNAKVYIEWLPESDREGKKAYRFRFFCTYTVTSQEHGAQPISGSAGLNIYK